MTWERSYCIVVSTLIRQYNSIFNVTLLIFRYLQLVKSYMESRISRLKQGWVVAATKLHRHSRRSIGSLSPISRSRDAHLINISLAPYREKSIHLVTTSLQKHSPHLTLHQKRSHATDALHILPSAPPSQITYRINPIHQPSMPPTPSPDAIPPIPGLYISEYIPPPHPSSTNLTPLTPPA